MTILEEYIKSKPSDQNALDLFINEWSSELPQKNAELKAGKAKLFDDPRINWAIDQMGGVKSKTVIELGPLEAGHSYMLEKAGAKEITAIEANTHAYLKCLIVKEILQLQKSRFLLGDFVKYLRNSYPNFDICIAHGVLYHMIHPVELIKLISNHSNKVTIWTHYYDEKIISNNRDIKHKFPSQKTINYQGFRCTYNRQEYKKALGWMGFCGGSAPYSNWLGRNDIIRCLNHFGFNKVKTEFEQPLHPNGPSFALVASKK